MMYKRLFVLVHNVDKLVKKTSNIKTNLEELKSIPIWDQFH